MCVIIDANVMGVFINSTKEKNRSAWELKNYIQDRRILLVFGGKKLKKEYRKNNDFSRWLRLQILGGSANVIDDKIINVEEKKLKIVSCLSDDEHVLALAKVSGARLLYTKENALAKDFKNRKLIGGKVYRAEPPKNELTQQPKGKKYNLTDHTKFTSSKKRLLEEANCRL
ncbi:MAG: hypothetical protein OXF46_02215 [Rhodobacteraceae bacterium]|nr:hypothetical protein [Paracoccaceae bacterium]